MPVEVAKFRLSIIPYIGIFTQNSLFSIANLLTPFDSFPNQTANLIWVFDWQYNLFCCHKSNFQKFSNSFYSPTRYQANRDVTDRFLAESIEHFIDCHFSLFSLVEFDSVKNSENYKQGSDARVFESPLFASKFQENGPKNGSEMQSSLINKPRNHFCRSL